MPQSKNRFVRVVRAGRRRGGGSEALAEEPGRAWFAKGGGRGLPDGPEL